MTPRVRHSDTSAPAKLAIMALSPMIKPDSMDVPAPANDVDAGDRPNILVARRRRLSRRANR